jgi:hypothetical protein
MVAYHDKANAILIKGFQTRHEQHRILAYNAIMQRLTDHGITVTNQVLDTKASEAYIAAITNKWNCTYQLVPPDMHRCSMAELAIGTFKAHFLSILAGVDPNFPKNRWDLLLPQAELTLNLLCQSHANLSVSSWEYCNGPYNFDATPMGPPGSRIIAHAQGTTRKSWDFCGKTGFYIGPSLVHYRCYNLIRGDT